MASDLLLVPRDLVEYVICHDLVHLRVPDHGKGFEAMINGYMPDWQERERRLAAWALGELTHNGRRAGHVASDSQ